LPRRFRRRGEEQRGATMRLKLQFQLHLVILAERVDNGCPTVAKKAARRGTSHALNRSRESGWRLRQGGAFLRLRAGISNCEVPRRAGPASG
jgi:hypothetical protein